MSNVEIVGMRPFRVSDPQGKLQERTMVTYRDALGELRTKILSGTIRDVGQARQKIQGV